MKEITYLNKNYNLPESWDDITIEQVLKINELKDKNKTWTNIINILIGLSYEDLRNANISDVEALKDLLFFTNEAPEFKPAFEFEFNNEKWILTKDLFNITYGQYEDCMTYEKNHTENKLKRITLILSVILEEQSQKKYDCNLNEQRAIMFEKLPCNIALGIYNFFLSTQRLSMIDINAFMKVKGMRKKVLRDLARSPSIGADMLRLTHWQRIRQFWKGFTAKKQL